MAAEHKDDHLDRRIPESKEEGSFDRDLHRTLNLTIGQINDLEEKIESCGGSGGPGGGGAAPARVEQLENPVEEFESDVESALSSFEEELGELEARDEVFTEPVELRAESAEVIGSDGAGRHTVEFEPVQIEAENEEEGGEDSPFDFVRDHNYRYKVQRDLDGSGANAWEKGAAVANTGRKRSGFIDLYAERSRRAENESELPDGRNDSESSS